MEFFRQEYWSGLPLPSRVDLPNPGIKPPSPCHYHRATGEAQSPSIPQKVRGKTQLVIDMTFRDMT